MTDLLIAKVNVINGDSLIAPEAPYAPQVERSVSAPQVQAIAVVNTEGISGSVSAPQVQAIAVVNTVGISGSVSAPQVFMGESWSNRLTDLLIVKVDVTNGDSLIAPEAPSHRRQSAACQHRRYRRQPQSTPQV